MRTGQDSGNRLSEVLGATGELIYDSCSFILALSNLSHDCKGKRDTILEGPGDRFGSHCARHPVRHTIVEMPLLGITQPSEPSRWVQRKISFLHSWWFFQAQPFSGKCAKPIM